MKTKLTLVVLTLVIASFLTSCEMLASITGDAPAKDDNEVTIVSDISEAPEATFTKYTMASQSFGGAMSGLGDLMMEPGVVTGDPETGDFTINYSSETLKVTGSMKMNLDTGASHTSMKVTFIDAPDGYGNTVTGTMTNVVDNSTELTTVKISGSLTATFADGSKTSLGMNSTTIMNLVDYSSSTTGSVTIDGKKYSVDSSTPPAATMSIVRAVRR